MCVEVGKSPGGEADFSTALLTKGVSSFGRNDDSLDGEKKNRQTATARAKAKCGDSSPFDFAQGQNDRWWME
jgi:hypothetical protein